jgi:hemolysin III
LAVLLSQAGGRPVYRVSYLIYGLSLIAMYSASALYHLLPVSSKLLVNLRKFDHIAIYLLISGTYVPLCLFGLKGTWGIALVSIEGALALVGTIAVILFKGGPSWLRATLYVVMGWLAVVAIGPMQQQLSSGALHWLFAGGVVYTVGAVVYVLDKPSLIPGRFSAHDLWHLFVIAGTVCHFQMIFGYLR